MNTVRSELLKIRSLAVGWATAFGVLLVTLLALLFWYLLLQAQDVAADDMADVKQSVFTAGQYFGLLLTMIFGVTIVTSEYTHQTITSTFLATPRRSRVVLAKITAGLFFALSFFAISTVLAVGGGTAMLLSLGVPAGTELGTALGAVALNALAYVIWMIFGVGLGTMIRNQVVAVVAAIVLYLGELGSGFVFPQLAAAFEQDWIRSLQYYLPGGASRAMTSVIPLEDMPAWWIAALVLLVYGVLTTAYGTLITAARDVS
ncbi:ABC transporter permease [Cryptosporangium aurantiacum]|uniref:ABC-2 family transporter protein n=1 Tax=Cryptosporangium aurantiacum TaxID=134849 RepID=A0A1M7QM60_9ACTN|nr:ABC transporter permease [Cryptosporangium aurantiacum]SHN32340.1 ABC-2 family transporter protein [Cryptosporangium aurantiacum]